ncbi:DUF6059 family protein [Streptomyces monashensis]|uniref:Uncharacterized protein n=1 Tax=Streptomyces monashensis TaxID=1678012 RepID=A0A1S2P9T7_9ACTN|nr:DUF6059 family protein [Streptomyces monashensis]OIJ90471.1 hypothetical protein BIV23_40135 [Streptomyces monashensis]
MNRPLARHLARLVHEAYRSLVAYGRLWTWMPSDPLAPPGAHPLERVRPDIPLTPVERALDQQLSDLDRLG